MATFKQYSQTLNDASEAFSIDSFTSDEIKVRVDGVLKTAATHYNITSYTTNGGTVEWTSGNIPAENAVVRIYRITDLDPARATYTAGSAVKAGDLNNNQTQVLRALQEENDQLIQTWDIEDNAITAGKIKDLEITNSDVSASAEIAVSKLADGSARQLLQTDSGGTGVEWTSNIDVPGTLDVTGAATFDSTVAITGAVTVSSTVDGRDVAADGTKLDGIEAGATANQTNAEIRAAVEAASDSNVFTDADHTKLNAIEAGATADQTNAEIRAAVEAATDSNVFTDADHTKLNGIAAGAGVNVQSNWNASSGDSQILNKPSLVSGINDLSDVDTTGVANDKILKYVSADSKWKVADDGGSGSALTVIDESTTLSTGATKFTFTGAGVTATEPSADEITVTIPGTDTNTTYTTSFVDSSNDCILRLTDSGSGTDDLKFVAGSNITLTPDGDNLTIASSGGGAGNATDFKYLELRNAANNGAASYPAADFTLVTAGTTTAISPDAANALLVSYAGVIQQPNTGTSTPTTGFAINGSTIKFGSNITAAPDFIIYLSGGIIATVSDNAITLAKLEDGTSGNDGKFLRANNGADPTWETVSTTPEGTAILSTGETGTAKFLRIDGDNSCSWQVPPDTNTQVSIDDTPVNGVTNEAISSNWAYDHNAGTGNSKHVPAAGSSGEFLKHDGTWGTPPDTNTQLTLLDEDNFATDSATAAASQQSIKAYVDAGDLSLIDEDNMASDSATRPPSQQSVKAYVDNNAGTTINSATENELVTVANNTAQLDAEASLTFQDSATTGLISGRQVTGRGFECPATVSDDWTIAAGNNAMFPGPMTVAANKTVTVPANRTLTIV